MSDCLKTPLMIRWSNMHNTATITSDGSSNDFTACPSAASDDLWASNSACAAERDRLGAGGCFYSAGFSTGAERDGATTGRGARRNRRYEDQTASPGT